MENGIKPNPEGKKVKGVADIVFCFDCTGSMQPYIDAVKANVNAFVKGLGTDKNVVLDWRVRAMGYRDFGFDTEKLINHFEFVNDANEFEAQLDQLETPSGSGGDDPESTLDAIWYALKKTDWRNPCHKVIVLFTDAPPHPVHETTVTDLGIGSDDVELLKQELMIAKIKLFMFCLKDPVYEKLREVPGSSITTYDDPKTELLSSDFSVLLNQIGKTVTEGSKSGGVTY
jgi:hypothetical protein